MLPPVESGQYTALRYSERPADVGALASIGSVGDSYDNAMAESVVGLYKNECVKIDGPFRTVDELELATLSWVHWFNENRLHSSIDYQTPLEAEQEYYRHNRCGYSDNGDTVPDPHDCSSRSVIGAVSVLVPIAVSRRPWVATLSSEGLDRACAPPRRGTP